MNEILRPEIIHHEIYFSYKKVMQEFIDTVQRFLKLNEGEEINGENMSILCLRKDFINENEYYVDFYWNHFQKNEKHFIELNKEEDGAVYIVINSTTYQFNHILDKLIETESAELYKMYLHLYYANAWFRQLADA